MFYTITRVASKLMIFDMLCYFLSWNRCDVFDQLKARLSLDQSIKAYQVTKQKIKNAVWTCNGDKAQGPDGLSFAFIKKYWEIHGADIIGAISEFHATVSIPCGSNSSFITLIAKVNDPVYILDYRSISLIGVVYKIIAKLLSTRLQIAIGYKFNNWKGAICLYQG